MLFGLILVESAVVCPNVWLCRIAEPVKETSVSIMFDMD